MRRLSPRDRDYKFCTFPPLPSTTPTDTDPSSCIDAKKFKDNWLHPGKTAEVVHIYLASGADLRSSVRAQKFANTL
jgi:hypothetical protein